MTRQERTNLNKDRRTVNGIVPSFQHRHFAYMAAMIALLNPIIRKDIAVHFASNLGRTNERFDYNRFLNACGLEHIEADQAVAEYEEILKIQN